MVTDSIEAPAAPAQPKGAGPGGSRFGISGDKIQAATSGLPERQRDALRWIAGFCIRTNQSHRDVAPKLKKPNGEPYTHDSLYHALTGGRDTDQLGPMVEAIERFRKLTEEREQVTDTGFIETQISRRIWQQCRKALRRNRILFIWGQSQIGKTFALEAYAKKHNHGETRYLRLPVGCGFMLFLRLLAEALHVPLYQSELGLRDAIIGAVDDHMLLIIDEMHEPFGADGRNKLGVKIVNFLREVYDRKKCGMVLCGTDVFREALTLGIFARNMQQILRRGLPPLQLPKTPSPADLALFARAYKLGDAPDKILGVRVSWIDEAGAEKQDTIEENPLKLQTQIVEDHGLGRWVTILQEAEDLAVEKKRALTWGLVIHAWHSFEQSSRVYGEAA